MQDSLQHEIESAPSKIKCMGKEENNKKVPQASITIGFAQLNRNEDTMVRKKLTIEDKTQHTHFTWEQRLQLQYYYTGGNTYKKDTISNLARKDSW